MIKECFSGQLESYIDSGWQIPWHDFPTPWYISGDCGSLIERKVYKIKI